jgi:Protein of unknown function (DUF2971).
MQALHLVCAEFGLKDIRERRLKVATFADLNDPFEFYAAAVGDREIRRKLRLARNSVASRVGILCFSRHWHNPVLWSHYADRHRGICLGFEVADEIIAPVVYAGRRFHLRPDPLKVSGAPDAESVKKLMLTKYAHWKYESELRSFVPLEPAEAEQDLFYAEFGPRMKLTTVIVGAHATIARADVLQALGSLASEVDVMKARLAFRSFRVVPQRNRELW